MKGIIIIEFNENDNLVISTQYPINICEFLKVTPELLRPLSDQHLAKKQKREEMTLFIKFTLTFILLRTHNSFINEHTLY